MLKGLFGPSTLTSQLRGGLEEASATHKAIAERIANASQSSSHVDFSSELTEAQSRLAEADLQRDMAALADTQLRYEADARLLQEAYARLRTAFRERG